MGDNFQTLKLTENPFPQNPFIIIVGNDKRILVVYLTDKGRDKVEKVEESLLDLNFSMMKYIDLDDQENIPEMLEKLVWAMDCIREELF